MFETEDCLGVAMTETGTLSCEAIDIEPLDLRIAKSGNETRTELIGGVSENVWRRDAQLPSLILLID